jgi:uncharacterized protein
MEIKLSNDSKVDAQLIMTGRGCIIGQSGSGKSFLVGIIAEELSKLKLPYCIVDTEGEYASLKSYFKAITIGGSNQDFGFDTDFSSLFSSSIKDNVPIILDLSDESDKKAKVYHALEEIYKTGDKLRIPYLVIIEEADKFVPQVVNQKINIIEELSVRGRKRGIGLIVATQRPSNISKNVLSQCSYGFIGKLTIENDLKAIKQLFPDKSKLKEIVDFSIGEFMPFGTGFSNKFKVRITDVTQKGSTPLVNSNPIKGSKPALDELIGILKSKNNTTKKSNTSGKQRITALSMKFSTNDAHAFARKIATRRFGIFGRPIEEAESIKINYLMAALCKIRMPTKKKHEFEEYAFLIDRNFKLIKLQKSIRFEENDIGNPKQLNPLETSLLSELRSRRKMPIANVDKLKLADTKQTGEAIRNLIKLKLITKDSKNLYADNYTSYLMREIPDLENIYVSGKGLDSNKISKDLAKIYSANLYPKSILVDFSIVYIPVYEIILRHKNKIRMFHIDGLYGKEVADM